MNIKRDYFILIIVLIAATVRLWGINFGLPNTECRPDEAIITDIVYSPLRSFHPGTFNYPSLYKYMVLFLYICYFLFGLCAAKYHSAAQFLAEYLIAPAQFYLINRLLAASLGIATVFLVYKIARYIFDTKTAVISALFLSLAHLHVRDSHFGLVDIPLTFFMLCSMWFILKSSEKNTIKYYVLGGIFAGLSASIKYQGILLAIPMCIVHFFNTSEDRKKTLRLFLDQRILLFFFTFICSFLIGTPYAIISFPDFISDIAYEFKHLEYGHGIILGRGWMYHLRFSLWYGLGGSLFFASLAGIVTLFGLNRKKALLLCCLPLAYFIIIGKGNTVFLRYTIPIIPFLCITASVFTVYISDRLLPHFRPYERNIAAYLLAVILISPSAYNVLRSDFLLAKKDNRLAAAEWISQNIPEASSIYQNSRFPPGKVKIYPTLSSLPKTYYNPITKITYRIPKSVLMNMPYLLKRKHTVGYEEWKYNETIKRFIFQGKTEENFPEYIIVEESPLLIYSTPQNDIQEILKKAYTLKAAFSAIDVNEEKNRFDQQDAFYLPFAGFKNIKRPGPNLYIYKRNPQNAH